jgi:hypothetical protein
MSLGQNQVARCLTVLDKLSSRAVSRVFARPVDPIRDNIPSYFALVSHPMDLGTVRQKLLENEYQTVAAFREDVELIWANSFAVNPKTTISGAITTELQTLFRKLTQHLTDNSDSDWVAGLQALRDELTAISRASLKREQPKPPGAKPGGEKPKHVKKPPHGQPETPKIPVVRFAPGPPPSVV